MDFFTRLLDTSDFSPRWECGRWSPEHGWLHILSDLGIWSAYVAIPLVLGFFYVRRKDLPFRKIFVLFGAFILLCGTTHLMDALIFYWPAYRLAALIKLCTALVSWATVAALAPVVPRALAMRSPEELEGEITARLRAEKAIQDANEELERRITERTAALTQVTEELREADRRKDEFLAMLAHELRNPLAPIRNALEVLRLSEDAPHAVARARHLMERQVGQMVRLVDDLMDVSRIARGKLQLRQERLSLAVVLEHAVETSRPLIEQQKHRLTVALPDEPLHVEADLARLGQVFSNLLNNAAKYTEQGGHIRLSATRKGGAAEVTVTDTGVGIPHEAQARLFEPFSQVEQHLERSQGGLGIGLALVKGIVELHGGTVEVQSDGHGKGSEFRVRLPAAKAGQQTGPSAPAESAGAARGRRVLVVDDNRDAAGSMALMLSLVGNETRTAYDGQEALEVAEAFRPDVVVLDLGLPKMNGYDVCRKMRQQPWGGRALIVAATGWGQEDDRRRSQEAGFDHHLVKPVDPAQLLGLLAEWKEPR